MHRLPQDLVQLELGGLVHLLEVHAQRGLRPRRVLAVRLADVDAGRADRVRPRIRRRGEGSEEGGRRGVVLAHRGQAEEELDRAQHARGRVERRVDRPPPRPGARHQQDGTVGVHVVGAVLRVVLEDEDRRLGPEPALRDGFDHAAQGHVVLGHHRAGRAPSRLRAHRVVVAEVEDAQAGKPALLLEPPELLEPDVDALVVRDGQVVGRNEGWTLPSRPGTEARTGPPFVSHAANSP